MAIFSRAAWVHPGTASMAIAALFVAASMIPQPAHAIDDDRDGRTPSSWWAGKRATGDGGGVRSSLEDNGLSLIAQWRGIYFGVVASENGSAGAFAQQMSFAAELDIAKLTRSDALSGLSAFGTVRWRDPGHPPPNEVVGASRLFNPSRFSGGWGWRLLNFGLAYTTPTLFGADEFFTIRAGWLQPQREFVEQPLSRQFVNNAMVSARGLGGNIVFSSSFNTWGATIQIKPLNWYYAKSGLFMTYPDPTSPFNNGLMFQGISGANGAFTIGETGITPELGAAKLPGRYAFGGYYYGANDGQYVSRQSGFYWQADQMLFREPATSEGAFGRQGLRIFSLFLTAPASNSNYPFYFHSGLVYEGLIPARDRDQIMFATIFGQYSADTQPGHSNTTVLEAGYRFEINRWAFIQPFVQYIVQPAGNTTTANAAILGLFMGVDF